MNNFRTHKIIAFFLAVLMILPLIPAVDLTVFAVSDGSSEDPYSQIIGSIAQFNIDEYINFAVDNDPSTFNDDSYEGEWDTHPNYVYYYDGGGDPTTAQYDFFADLTLVITDYYVNSTTLGLWY